MNKEQHEHYMKGGMFTAMYSPKVTYDLDVENRLMIGQEITCYQNYLITPGGNLPQKYPNQHMFSSRDIRGYFPEEDIEILRTIDDYLEYPEELPMYVYRMTYTTEEQIVGNFGKWENKIGLPLIVERSYPMERDDYVLNELSTPPATLVEKAIYYGKFEENIEFKTISK